MRRGFPLTLIRTAPASGETQERRTMKRYLTLFAKMMALFAFASSPCKADGVFTVTQYNLNTRPNSIDVAENVLKTPSIWVGSPVTKTYSTISFADNPGVNPPFSMVSFPGNGAGKHECFVVEAAGFIKLDAGSWTFACGGDDGYSVSISGHGFSSSFVSAMPLGYDVTTKTMDIPSSGIYHVRILYFEYGACAVLHFSSANGPYSSFNSSMFHLVKAVEVFTVSFNANGGSGKMETEEAVSGEVITLPDNAFFLNGYVFQGWATSPDGPVVYSDGEEITVDSDKTLYAVWKAEGGMIQLSVARADPAAGSLTLAWEEEKPIEGMTYSVWRGTGDERSAAVCVAPSVTGNTWTDEEYWKAEPVLEPLRYWVVADAGGKNERESNCVETRHRMGLCVGFDAYGTKATPHRQSLADASLCKAQAEGAKFSMKPVLKNSAASVDGIHNALAELAEEAKPGDTVLFYIATHGGVRPSKNKAVLTAYNGHYTVSQLATDVAAFHSDVGFIGIIMACHSRALSDGSVLSPGDELNWFLENGLAECKANVGWVTSCGMDESSWNLAGSKQTMFGEWFLNQGWKNGYADRKLSGVGYGGGNGDGTHTALELARYAEAFSRGVSDDKPSHVFYQNEALLGKTIMATEVASGGANIPTAPTTVTASQVEFDSKIYVSWASSSGALWYWLEGKMENSVDAWKCLSYETRGTDFQDTESLVGQNYQYRVRAVNGAGASGFSPIATGSRGTVPFIDWLRGKGEQIGLSGTAAELATMSSANGMSLEACYVSGIDPLDASAAFKAKLAREDGKWTAKPEGGEKEGRVYRVEGKREMTDDEDWTDLTDVEDVEAEGWHFFRVGVELAE